MDSEQKAEAIKALCLWMTECYQFNQARVYAANATWARFYPELSEVSLAALTDYDRSAESPEIVETTINDRLPRRSVLFSMDARNLLNVRADSRAEYYFSALKDWRRDPRNDVKKRAVQEEFQGYALALRRKLRGVAEGKEVPITQKLLTYLSPQARVFLTGLSSTFGAYATDITARAAPFIGLGTAAYAIYEWGIRSRPIPQEYTLKAAVELNLSG